MPTIRTTTRHGLRPRLLLLALTTCWTSLPASAEAPATPDPDQLPLRLSASLSSTWDDNLTRSATAGSVTSDRITRLDAGLAARRVWGPQNADADVEVARTLYRSHATEDFTALNARLGVGSELGRDAALRLQFRQTQELLPLENFQSLVRDVLTGRTLTLGGWRNFGTLWKLEAEAEHGWYTNDAPAYSYNDFQSNAATLGLTYNLSQDSHVGLRVNASATGYGHPLAGAQTLPSGSGAPGTTASQDPGFTDRRLEPFATWTPSAGITLRADLALVDRSYTALPGQNVHSTYGKLDADYNRGGRLSGGLGLQRDLGGTMFLASRVVESDGVLARTRYELTASSALEAHLSAFRRRYSVDQAGYPAHREYENLADLAWTAQVRRDLDLRVGWTGDWRRSNPAAFGYTDHRLMLTLRYQP